MKQILISRYEMNTAKRWDIDFHLPSEEIKKFPPELLKRLGDLVTIVNDKRNPERNPDEKFQYIDISSVDISVGTIVNQQELEGSNAPYRARKVVRAFDLIISTCRPTRGAIAVVPISLHNEIASTGFCVIRPKSGINPYYLLYALRLPSTIEQFRKQSTGINYPSILDEDVLRTFIPVPISTEQDRIAGLMVNAVSTRDCNINRANEEWHRMTIMISAERDDNIAKANEELQRTVTKISAELTKQTVQAESSIQNRVAGDVYMPHDIQSIEKIISDLAPPDNWLSRRQRAST